MAQDPDYAEIKQQLEARLRNYLRRAGDPRLGPESPWDEYLYYGEGGNARLY